MPPRGAAVASCRPMNPEKIVGRGAVRALLQWLFRAGPNEPEAEPEAQVVVVTSPAQAAVDEDPRNARLWLHLGEEAQKGGEPARAVQAFRIAAFLFCDLGK